MTNDEAIKYLEYLKDNYTRQGGPMCHAVETAIEALKPKQAHTNADRIRQMTDEEMSDFLGGLCNDYTCLVCEFYDIASETCDPLKWLKQEAEQE